MDPIVALVIRRFSRFSRFSEDFPESGEATVYLEGGMSIWDREG